jgi:hypothetical protein
MANISRRRANARTRQAVLDIPAPLDCLEVLQMGASAGVRSALGTKFGTLGTGKMTRRSGSAQDRGLSIIDAASNYPKYGKYGNNYNVKTAARNVMFSAIDRMAKPSAADRKALRQKALSKGQRKSEGRALAKAKSEQKRIAAKAESARISTIPKAREILRKLENEGRSSPLSGKLFLKNLSLDTPPTPLR